MPADSNCGSDHRRLCWEWVGRPRTAMQVGLDEIWERVSVLGATLRAALADVRGVTVRDIGSVQGAIVTFTVDGREADDVKAALRDQAINVSVVTPAFGTIRHGGAATPRPCAGLGALLQHGAGDRTPRGSCVRL